jgi:hypothetical protein
MYLLSEATIPTFSASLPDPASTSKLPQESPKVKFRSSSIRSHKSKSLDLSAEVLKGMGLGKELGIDSGPMITTTPPTPTLNSDEDILYRSAYARLKSYPLSTATKGGPGKLMAKDIALFNSSVLELVKLIQASLAIFGMFPFSLGGREGEMDGLLCDVAVDGIQRWVAEIGEPCVGVEVGVWSKQEGCKLIVRNNSLWRELRIP